MTSSSAIYREWIFLKWLTNARISGSIIETWIVEGEYHWPKHDNDDEFFSVLEGQLLFDLEDQSIELNPNLVLALDLWNLVL